MNKGSAHIPVKILEDISEGKLSPSALGVFLILQLQADCTSGIWMGSVEKLQAYFPTYDESALEWYIERLEKARLIRCFRQPGRKSNYSILIHNYLVTDGGFFGQSLNAWKSANAESLVYEEVAA